MKGILSLNLRYLSCWIRIYGAKSTNLKNTQYVAMLLFCEYVDGATALSQSCGGGSYPGYGWGKDPKEDDWLWARRCLKKAKELRKHSVNPVLAV